MCIIRLIKGTEDMKKMTISEKNIVKRWNMMASKDLGYDRNF